MIQSAWIETFRTQRMELRRGLKLPSVDGSEGDTKRRGLKFSDRGAGIPWKLGLKLKDRVKFSHRRSGLDKMEILWKP